MSLLPGRRDPDGLRNRFHARLQFLLSVSGDLGENTHRQMLLEKLHGLFRILFLLVALEGDENGVVPGILHCLGGLSHGHGHGGRSGGLLPGPAPGGENDFVAFGDIELLLEGGHPAEEVEILLGIGGDGPEHDIDLVGLEELPVGIDLHLDQVGRADDLLDLAVVHPIMEEDRAPGQRGAQILQSLPGVQDLVLDHPGKDGDGQVLLENLHALDGILVSLDPFDPDQRDLDGRIAVLPHQPGAGSIGLGEGGEPDATGDSGFLLESGNRAEEVEVPLGIVGTGREQDIEPAGGLDAGSGNVLNLRQTDRTEITLDVSEELTFLHIFCHSPTRWRDMHPARNPTQTEHPPCSDAPRQIEKGPGAACARIPRSRLNGEGTTSVPPWRRHPPASSWLPRPPPWERPRGWRQVPLPPASWHRPGPVRP